MSQELAVPRGAWSDTPRPLALLFQMEAVAEADVRKLLHDPIELFSRMLQPVLWLVIFAPVFSRTRAIPTGGLRYLDFMAPGVLAQSVMFGAIFYGISVIWERDQGILQKFLVSPAPRFALVADGRSHLHFAGLFKWQWSISSPSLWELNSRLPPGALPSWCPRSC